MSVYKVSCQLVYSDNVFKWQAYEATFGSQQHQTMTTDGAQPEIESVKTFPERGKPEGLKKNPCGIGENQRTFLLTYSTLRTSHLCYPQ